MRRVFILFFLLHAVSIITVRHRAIPNDLFDETVSQIFERRCLDCHHEKNRQGGLSLSTGKDFVESGVVDLDQIDDSLLLQMVIPHQGKAEMPKDAEPLKASEIDAIRRWISEGANWPVDRRLESTLVRDRDWWSLRPISKPSFPSGISGNPIDAFIDRSLSRRGLSAVRQAGPETLVRRVYFDLTGLPPNPNDVDHFLRHWNRDSEFAWRELVDRLLDSPGYGEKWAQHWLDLARFAETHGYDKDKPRNNAWPYRDYVIQSFNEDKPYVQFVKEQVAGDVLFEGDPNGIVGLGFLAAGPWDFIGHWEVGEDKLDGRIAKHLDRDEMISAVFNAFLSTTVQCAQCHHHKFDPISMRDYYRLHAVFAAIDRTDRIYAGLTDEQQNQAQDLNAAVDSLRRSRKAILSGVERRVANEASTLDQRINELKKKYGQTELRPQYGYHSQIVKDANVEKWVQIDLMSSTAASQVRLIPAFDQFAGIGAGFGFPVRYRVDVSNFEDFGSYRTLLNLTQADQPNPLSSPVTISSDGNAFRYLRVTATKLRERSNDFIFALGEVEVLDANSSNLAVGVPVTAKDSIEAPVRWSTKNLVDGIYYQALTDEDSEVELNQLVTRRGKIEKRFRTQEIEDQIAKIDGSIDDAQKKLKSIPAGRSVFAVSTSFKGGGKFKATGGKPRPIRLLHRGDMRTPGETLAPGAPALWAGASDLFFEKGSWNEGQARARLAEYLTDRRNPLVWRSIANRVWGWTFGNPLVATPNDFGRGGQRPSHPELLDYLAAEIRDDPNHSIKSLVRLMVTSKAYRRSGQVDPAMSLEDSSNVFLWRTNRRRLTAEEFRDSVMAVSGVLDRTMGGPSYRDFEIEKPAHSPHYEYDQFRFDKASSHRRSAYRFVVRSQPQPMMMTLDCADPSISVPRREESTTPLQAMACWNNPLVEFAARKFGERLKNHSLEPREQVDFACRTALGRRPDATEVLVLETHLKDHGAESLARLIFNLNAFVYLD